jgi:hypothetical protein
MSVLANESRIVQNPGLGAVLLWRFATGYTESHRTKESPVIQLAFLVLPIVYHRETCELVTSTQRQSGLHGFVDKFSRSDVVKSDVLLSIHTRALTLRSLTIESLRVGVRHRLVGLLTSAGQFVPLTTSAPSAVPNSTRPLLAVAEKLGAWCAPLSLFEIASALKVSF